MICKKCGYDVDKYEVIACHDGAYCPCGAKL
jgi:hypothetical protein